MPNVCLDPRPRGLSRGGAARRAAVAAGLIAMACPVSGLSGCGHGRVAPPQSRTAATSPASAAAEARPAPDAASGQEPSRFSAGALPILQSECSPCHFAGGNMYDRLPFDDPGTLRKLGDKLFTRIKDEKQQAVIREFLAAP